MCTKLFSDELAWNPFCTIKSMAEASFFLVLILWFIFNFSSLQLQSSIYKGSKLENFFSPFREDYKFHILCCGRGFCVYLYHLRCVWMIHKSSIPDEVSVMIPDEVQRKLFCYSVCSRKIIISATKKNRHPQKHAKSLIHMYKSSYKKGMMSSMKKHSWEETTRVCLWPKNCDSSQERSWGSVSQSRLSKTKCSRTCQVLFDLSHCGDASSWFRNSPFLTWVGFPKLQLGVKERFVGPIQISNDTWNILVGYFPSRVNLADLTLQSEEIKYPQNGRLDFSHV